MTDDGLNNRNLFGLCIITAAIIVGASLVLRQIVALQRVRAEGAIKMAQMAPTPVPLAVGKGKAVQSETVKIEETQRDVDDKDKLEAYEQEEKRPGLIQIFRMGQQLSQKKVEGVEYVKAVMFRTQVGTGRVLADVAIHNDSGFPITPRFQLILFNAKGKFLCRDTVLYITEELAPGDKKIETMSLPRRPEGVAYYELRKLD